MAVTLATNFRGSIDWLFRDAQTLTTIADAAKLEYTAALADGTGSDQANRIWHDARPPLAAGSNDDLDLTALATTVLGSSIAINIVTVKAVLIINLATAAADKLRLDTSATNGWTGPTGGAAGKIEVGADSVLLLTAKKSGWAVDGTHKILRITNAGVGSISYRIVVVGTSA